MLLKSKACAALASFGNALFDTSSGMPHVSRGLHVRTVIGNQCGQFPYRLLSLRISIVDMLRECFNAGLRFVGVACLNL